MNTSEIDFTTYVHHFPQHGMTVTSGSPFSRSSRPPCARRDEARPVGNMADDDLATRVALGDIDAATEIIGRYTKHLTYVAFKIVGDDAEAEQVVESAFEAACHGWPPERGQVKRWLTRITRRLAKARKRVLLGSEGFDA